MIVTPLVLLALAATGLADVPAGYKTVYITSNVNAKFVVVPKAAKSGSTVVVQTLNNKPEQQWYIKDGQSKIQLAGTTLCLDAGAKSRPFPLSPPSFGFGASANSSQATGRTWPTSTSTTAPTRPTARSGTSRPTGALPWPPRVRVSAFPSSFLPSSLVFVSSNNPEECIDLQYMRATNNNPVGLYACAGLGGAGAGDKGINWPLAAAT